MIGKHSLEIKYHFLKVILSCFFTYEQLFNKPDKRYDAFFASILGDGDGDFPDQVRILNWNYDFQFEKAYSEYYLNYELTSLQRRLKIFDSVVNPGYNTGFGIFKLNGTTTLRENSVEGPFWHLNEKVNEFETSKLILSFLTAFDYVRSDPKNYSTNLSFAWEATWNERIRNFLSLAERAVVNNEVLVVIGYCFPFFSRSIDKRMLNSLLLNKVYIQDTEPENVQSSILSVLPQTFKGEIELLKIFPSKDKVSQFFLHSSFLVELSHLTKSKVCLMLFYFRLLYQSVFNGINMLYRSV